jgi:hypothetical protein
MIMAPTIDDWYRGALEKVKEEVRNTPDATALGRDTDEWTEYLVRKWGMELIEADFGAIRMEETTIRGYPAIFVLVPVSAPDETVEVIAKHGLAGGGQWLGFDYSTFHSSRSGHFGQVVPQTPGEVQQARTRIEQYLQSLNSSIENANKTFPAQVRQIVVTKQEAVRAKDRDLDALSVAVGIPLVKRGEVSTLIPTAVRVREPIVPLLPPKSKPQERPVLERDKFDGIVDIIDNQCRQFERTPTAFQGMSEEALRDVMLSSLNGVFEGAADGEAFRVLGKTDIHLRISRGEVFIAELKVWSGPASLAEVVGQLLERLTWRDAYGVAVIFSKNSDFGAVHSRSTLQAGPLGRQPNGRESSVRDGRRQAPR